jgi:hypothetical protein
LSWFQTNFNLDNPVMMGMGMLQGGIKSLLIEVVQAKEERDS